MNLRLLQAKSRHGDIIVNAEKFKAKRRLIKTYTPRHRIFIILIQVVILVIGPTAKRDEDLTYA